MVLSVVLSVVRRVNDLTNHREGEYRVCEDYWLTLPNVLINTLRVHPMWAQQQTCDPNYHDRMVRAIGFACAYVIARFSKTKEEEGLSKHADSRLALQEQIAINQARLLAVAGRKVKCTGTLVDI